LTPDEVEELMRRDWDQRPRDNALYYIVTNAAESEEQFASSGEMNVREILGDVQALLPAMEAVLEIGCGIGRLLRPLSRVFKHAYGVDVSPEMIARAARFLSGSSNVSVWSNHGSDLEAVPTKSIDLVFSYLVFQHIPEVKVVAAYVRETFRVLKPGGVFKFQVAGRPEGRSASADESRVRDTWVGVNFSDAEARQLATEAGFDVRMTYSHHPPDSCVFLWVVAQKPV